MDEVTIESQRRVLMKSQTTHNESDEMTALADLAHLLLKNKEVEEAKFLLEQSLELARGMKNDIGLIVAHWGLADAAHLEKDEDEEILHLSQVVAMHLMMGEPMPKDIKERLERITG
ncbi:MAG: hypothetical protein ACKVHH_06395 [Candidatus Poseidoniales archaeon]|jgi:hypothetical protein|tara:strand:- start:514 stop:864 length:351 start_codon:yes stop_codon:yes gene_type:complete